MKSLNCALIATLALLAPPLALGADLPPAVKAVQDKGVQVLDEFAAPGGCEGLPPPPMGEALGSI